MTFAGTWHIDDMELWDEGYFNMEVQAYIKIRPDGMGDFQFGLVSGQLDGEVVEDGDEERFEFTWEGNDECDPASGRGWLKLEGKNSIEGKEGKIKLHLGDSSEFSATRAKRTRQATGKAKRRGS